MNSMPPAHLADFLRRPDVVDDDAALCVVYSTYMETPAFLETVRLKGSGDASERLPATFVVSS